jgi:anhydro-N-acetylmuramic acid kinase
MSGTSMDGIDASIIQSDGETEYNVILNKYFEYDSNLYKMLSKIRDKVEKSKDLITLSKELLQLEKEISLFHAKISNEIIQKLDFEIDFVGFHGQTIYHNSQEKISRQLGDGRLLSQMIKKKVVYNFRQNDLRNGGEGAPLTPIFHKLIVKQNKIDLPVCILNIGGISNVTAIETSDMNDFISRDLGPGNCLIDEWIRKKVKKKFDNNGEIAKVGKINKIILNQALENFDNQQNQNSLSFDIKDFDLGFVRGLSLEDGAATLTNFTGRVIGTNLFNFLSKINNRLWKVLLSGGGRKNNTLIETIKKRTSKNMTIQQIDNYGIDGDFIESQAFAYLAIRSYLGLSISFPKTTGCKNPSIGGVIIKNY